MFWLFDVGVLDVSLCIYVGFGEICGLAFVVCVFCDF